MLRDSPVAGLRKTCDALFKIILPNTRLTLWEGSNGPMFFEVCLPIFLLIICSHESL